MINPINEKLQSENQKAEAMQTGSQPAKIYPAYEPPKAEVISFDNEYVIALDIEGPGAPLGSYQQHTYTYDCPLCHGWWCVDGKTR